jgi:hypothetical protein
MCQNRHLNAGRAALAQGPGRFIAGAGGRKDIIDKQNALAFEAGPGIGPERALDILTTPNGCLPGLL